MYSGSWLWRTLISIGCLAAISCGGEDGEHGPRPGSMAGASAAGASGQAAAGGSAGPGAGGFGGLGASGGRGGAAGGGGANAGRGGAAAGGGVSMGERATYYVSEGALYDRCGEKVVLRGVNHPTLYVDRSGAALAEIAKTGANAVRLFWYTRVPIREADTAIASAIEAGMLPILEMHDSTCEWNLDPIANYWTSTQAVELIKKYESNLIINIANEPSAPNANEFRTKYSAVITKLREAGIRVPLMIDGANCGRDYRVLLSQGPALLEADPEHNLIFSAHLYDRMSQAAYADVFKQALDKQLTFIVGEFANKTPPGCGAQLDYAALITEANTNGIGWLAWSWGDNDPTTDWNGDCSEFDMTATFSFDSLRGWGKEVAVSLPASIKNTALRPASITRGSCR